MSYTQNFSETGLPKSMDRPEFPYQSFYLYNYGGSKFPGWESRSTYVYGNATWGTGDITDLLSLQPYALV